MDMAVVWMLGDCTCNACIHP